MPNKAHFLARIIGHRLKGQRRACPYCGESRKIERLQRKKWVLEILRCRACQLVFRWPMDTEDESYNYYQNVYSKEYAQVRLPSADELAEWSARKFKGTPLDLGQKIDLVAALRPSGRVLDYGCSWGYGTYQLAQKGFQAAGFEISKPRARYGREKLGLNIIDSFGELRSLPAKSFDVIFSHHVLEHLPNIKLAFETMSALLADDGLMFHILPNFTGTLARSGTWLMWIGEEHPIAPTIDFFRNSLPKSGFGKVRFASSPFDDGLRASLRSSPWTSTHTEGDELLILAAKTR